MYNECPVRESSVFRAVYKEADIYLLDDPLSAVDIRVGHHLFDDCICGFLEGKTRVLVTHQLQYLRMADDIVILTNVSLLLYITAPVNHKYILLQFEHSLPIETCLKAVMCELCEYYTCEYNFACLIEY